MPSSRFASTALAGSILALHVLLACGSDDDPSADGLPGGATSSSGSSGPGPSGPGPSGSAEGGDAPGAPPEAALAFAQTLSYAGGPIASVPGGGWVILASIVIKPTTVAGTVLPAAGGRDAAIV